MSSFILSLVQTKGGDPGVCPVGRRGPGWVRACREQPHCPPAPGRKEHSSSYAFAGRQASGSLRRRGAAWAPGKEGLAPLLWVASGNSLPWGQPGPGFGSPVQSVGQTGRARLALNGTLLGLHPCQLARVGADSAILRSEGKEGSRFCLRPSPCSPLPLPGGCRPRPPRVPSTWGPCLQPSVPAHCTGGNRRPRRDTGPRRSDRLCRDQSAR